MAWNAIAGAVTAAGIQGGVSLNTTAVGAYHTQKNNRLAQDYNFGMYNEEWKRQLEAWNMQNSRDDAIWNRQNFYDRMMWDVQNQYNSPMAQMQRFKEAGLNPNLIYGQGNTAQSMTTSNPGRAEISAPRTKDWHPQTPDFSGLASGAAAAMQTYNQMRATSAQVDNVKAQTDLTNEQRLNVMAETANRQLEAANIGEKTEGQRLANKHSQYDLNLKTDLRDYQVDAARLSVARVTQEMQLAAQKNQREASLNAATIKEIGERIQQIRQMTSTSAQEQALKKLEFDYKSVGPEALDYIYRSLGGAMNEFDNSPFVRYKWNTKDYDKRDSVIRVKK